MEGSFSIDRSWWPQDWETPAGQRRAGLRPAQDSRTFQAFEETVLLSRSLVCASIAALCLAGPARAAGPDYILVGAGATDFIRQDPLAGDFRAEYRSGYSLLPYFEQYVQVKPWAGGELSTKGAGWGGVGILLDIPLGSTPFFLSPSFGVGAYGRGHGKDLGSTVEFRSQFEGGYQFGDGKRVSVAFSHISNAGLTRHNPGTEAIVANLQFPLPPLLGR